MKYNSGMNQFHNNIIAALRYMLKNDKDITEKFCPGDGSPAPLRDYLKQKLLGKVEDDPCLENIIKSAKLLKL